MSATPGYLINGPYPHRAPGRFIARAAGQRARIRFHQTRGPPTTAVPGSALGGPPDGPSPTPTATRWAPSNAPNALLIGMGGSAYDVAGHPRRRACFPLTALAEGEERNATALALIPDRTRRRSRPPSIPPGRAERPASPLRRSLQRRAPSGAGWRPGKPGRDLPPPADRRDGPATTGAIKRPGPSTCPGRARLQFPHGRGPAGPG